LNAGEMSLHHNSIIHGSRPNRSDAKRIGFIVRYIIPQVAPGRGNLVLARGLDTGLNVVRR
jgi:ectoine hydroxylase-related dioxygenase (phytanoyl-CoA dioxygenase family)